MAVKRAKINAIASALGLVHGEVGDYVESSDFVVDPSLRNVTPIEYHGVAAKKGTGGYTGQQQSQGSTAPFAGKPATAPAAPAAAGKPAPAITSTEDDDKDCEGFVLTFGKHNGKTLLQVFTETPSYITWLAGSEKTSPDMKRRCDTIIAKYPNLAARSDSKPAPAPSSPPPAATPPAATKPAAPPPSAPATTPAATAAPAPTSAGPKIDPNSWKGKLMAFWAERGYNGKTDAKLIIGTELGDMNISFMAIAEDVAQKLWEKRETLFPNRETGEKIPCAKCGQILIPPEILFCKKYPERHNNQFLCYKHQQESAKAGAAATS
jgi:hypothetical protein